MKKPSKELYNCASANCGRVRAVSEREQMPTSRLQSRRQIETSEPQQLLAS